MPFTIKPIHHRRRWNPLPRLLRHRRGWRNLVGTLLVVAIFMFLGGALSLAMLTAWVSRDLPNPNTLLTRSVALSTKIYDRTGTHLLYEIHGPEARTLVKLEDLPAYVAQATIAVEDRNFYKHRGVAFKSIFRAAAFNLLGDRLSSFILRRPSGAGGASTITQQFVKNAILSPEKTLSRKIREFILSREIERRFTKDQILQLYFNEIPYGKSNYGVEAASQSYFKKSARDLTLAEAATLAALPQAPTTYLNNPDLLLGRRNFTLDLMVEQGNLARGEADRAKREPLTIQPGNEKLIAPHFVLWVKEQLTSEYGERTVEQGGLTVITTLDFEKQQAAEEAVENGTAKIEEKGGSNAALVAIDPKNGHILAMVGSRDYFDKEHDGAVNVALRARQPGSSFKPIVYTAGFIKGYTPTTILYDVVTSFKTDTKDYEPHNYDSKEHGPVTIRQALAGSLNIPAVKMIYLVGTPRVLDFAEELGYTTLGDRSRFGLSLVLGGGEVKLLEHANAFAVFANGGTHHKPISILKVEDPQKKVLKEWKEQEGKRALDEENARQITDILQDNNARAYVFGAQNHLTLPDRPVATKTGTTNDFRDAWTIGYTPSLAAGVWTGNNNNREMKRGADGSIIAAPIWQAFMARALKDAPIESFTPPQAVVTGKSVLDGQIPGQTIVRIDRASGFLATEFTPPTFIEERTFFEPHSILHYIRRDDPRGDPPTNPSEDPQYERFEEGVRRWVGEQADQSYGSPPLEFDNLHIPTNQPQLTVLEPLAGFVAQSYSINIKLETSAPRGVTRVRFIVDGVLIGDRRAPFDGTITLPQTLPIGQHTLTVTAFDDIDNSRSVNIPFTLDK